MLDEMIITRQTLRGSSWVGINSWALALVRASTRVDNRPLTPLSVVVRCKQDSGIMITNFENK